MLGLARGEIQPRIAPLDVSSPDLWGAVVGETRLAPIAPATSGSGNGLGSALPSPSEEESREAQDHLGLRLKVGELLGRLISGMEELCEDGNSSQEWRESARQLKLVLLNLPDLGVERLQGVWSIAQPLRLAVEEEAARWKEDNAPQGGRDEGQRRTSQGFPRPAGQGSQQQLRCWRFWVASWRRGAPALGLLSLPWRLCCSCLSCCGFGAWAARRVRAQRAAAAEG